MPNESGRARDDFTKEVKHVIADRVGGLCSNPDCRRPTKGPHTDDEKVLNLGEACHIEAAAEGGPRYNPAQSSEERKAAANGVWLCSACSTIVDGDEPRYPTSTLHRWKADAEAAATLALASLTASSVLEPLRLCTNELLAWPQTVANGVWLARPELDTARALLESDRPRPIVLLGPRGCGKSAFLARLGEQLLGSNWNVVAIKADRLPASIATLRQLADYIGLTASLNQTIYALASQKRTVVILDQLDALADLLDIETARLDVLMKLVVAVLGFGTVRIICSARDFEFRHDRRFEQLEAEELHLAPVAHSEVEGTLTSVGIDPQRLSSKLKGILRAPYWLKLFLRVASSSGPSPESERSLLSAAWELLVLRPASDANANDLATAAIASLMSDREELWLPRSLTSAHEPAVTRLLVSGLLEKDERTARISFTHQSLFEFARARAFVGRESLVDHVLKRQDALFVRPTIWMALGHLRDVDRGHYRSDLERLWQAGIRHHVRLLLIEFIGRLDSPEGFEEALILSLLGDLRWARIATDAMAGSQSWVLRLLGGPIENVMVGSLAQASLPVLIAGLKVDRDRTLELIGRHWSTASNSERVLAVLHQLGDWSELARDIADNALANSMDATRQVDYLAWQLKERSPEFAVDLEVRHLTRLFAQKRSTLPYSAPLQEDASEEERMRRIFHCEPRDTLRDFLRDVGHGSVFIDLATAAPKRFLSGFLSWLEPILSMAADEEARHRSYRGERLIDCSRTGGYVRELPHALRAAAETLALQLPDEFLALARGWYSSDLETIHVILSYGLEALGSSHPQEVVDYLVEDPRRLNLGEQSRLDARTTALLDAMAPVLSAAQCVRLEEAILSSQCSSESSDRPLDSRVAALELNRRHRLRLLRALPSQLLSQPALGMLISESTVFGTEVESRGPSGFRIIESPMSAAQMAKASDDNIVGLFEGLPDSTESRHPARWMEGGSVQASRELAAFTKMHPERGIKILGRLVPEKHQMPASLVVEALAETSFSTADLEGLVAALDGRGFCSVEFRTSAARALEKRAASTSGLTNATLALMTGWLGDVPIGARTSQRTNSDEHSASPSFLFGWGRGYMLPDGSFAILDSLSVALLSREPPRYPDWLNILNQHLSRDERPEVWRVFAHQLRFLSNCDRKDAAHFLDRLVAKYPDILEWREGVILLAIASWWNEGAPFLQKWLTLLRDSPWQYGSQAYGELVACIATHHQQLHPWAGPEVAQLLRNIEPNGQTVGLTHAVVHLWTEAATRARAEGLLMSLIAAAAPELDEIIFAQLVRDELVGDQSSLELFRAIVERKQPVPLKSLSAVVPWVVKLIHAAPDLVNKFAVGIIDRAHAGDDVRVHLAASSKDLVDVAIALQRMPGFRSQGLDLFERILELNLYGARQALHAIDSPQLDS